MGDSVLEDYHDRPVMEELYLIIDVKRRIYECPVCGTLCKVHQYERKLFVYQVLDESHRHRCLHPETKRRLPTIILVCLVCLSFCNRLFNSESYRVHEHLNFSDKYL